MPTNTSGGTTTSFNNTPQAVDDSYTGYEDWIFTFDVMANDLGGSAKILWSIDDSDIDGTTTAGGTGDGTIDLLAQDAAMVPEFSDLGARIWIENGKIKYDTNALDWLGAGETRIDHFTYAIRLANGTLSWATVTVTLTGRNDGPAVVLGGDDDGSVTEDALPTSAAGSFAFTDADLSDSHTVSVSPAASGYLGALTAIVSNDTTGDGSGEVSWQFSVDNADIQFLGEGDTLTQTYSVILNDGHGGTTSQTVTITITGNGDAPVIAAGNDSGDVGEDGDAYPLQATGTLGSSDVDVGDDPSWSAGAASYGTASIDPVTGEWTYDLDNSLAAVQELGEGDELSDSFVVTVTDEDGLTDTVTVTLTITGTDDQPTLAPVASGSVAEIDQSASRTTAGLTGTLVGNDVDGDSLTYGIQGGGAAGLNLVSLAGVYGTLTVNILTGSYTYAPDPAAIEALDVGQNPSDVFNVTVSDGTGPAVVQTYTVNLTGADDAPTLAPVTSGSVAEVPNSTSTTDSGLTGTLVGNDVDIETLTYGISGSSSSGVNLVSLAGTYGTLTVNTVTGAYTYVKNSAAIEALNAGQNPSDAFTVTVSDGDGPTVNQTYTVNITGANDGPVGVAPTDIKFSLNEANAQAQSGAQLNANTALGDFTAVDSDSSAWTFALTGTGASSFALSPASGLQSSVSLMVGGTNVTSGDYVLILTATDSDGNSKQETFTVHVGTTGTDSFTITTGTEIDFGLNGTDTLSGGAGDDALVGGQNADTLNGGLGTDELLGGGGNDNFVFQYDGTTTNLANYGIDRILDMNVSNDDTIQLDDALFAGITNLNLATTVVFGSAAGDANDRIIYNSTTGALYYDADGNGSGAAVQFAQLDAGTVLTISDFFVI
jgi:VCBS repeat-containing protein